MGLLEGLNKVTHTKCFAQALHTTHELVIATIFFFITEHGQLECKPLKTRRVSKSLPHPVIQAYPSAVFTSPL